MTTSTDYTMVVKNALDHLGFAKDELAYLALTSKPEAAIRDRLALRLRENFPVVGREWQRADLVAFAERARDARPVLIVELKAIHTLTGVKPRFVRECAGYIRSDLAKATLLAAGSDAQVLALLVAVHIDALPEGLPAFVVKYASMTKSALRTPGGEVALRAVCNRVVRGEIVEQAGARIVESGSIAGGSAYEVRVDIDYWILSPDPNAVDIAETAT